MQETYIVTVATEDGACLIQEKTTGSYSYLRSLLLHLSSLRWLPYEDTQESETFPGFGIQSSASDSSLPTPS